ncbi:MAG: LysR family transcriptional regulator [Alphaproteobacteria bacterium]
MDLNQIRYFIHLADTLSFTEAARRSGVSQPSLTKAIQRLEDELGGPLIYRDGKDSRLTPLGREIQVEFMRIDGLVSGVRELAENSVQGRSRTLTIGVATTISPAVFARAFAHALEQLPMVALNVEPMLPMEGVAEVLSGRYDACILTDPPKPSFKITALALFRERLMLAMAADHPLSAQNTVTPEQMAEQPYLDRLHCEFRSQVIEHFMNRNVVMRPRLLSEREDWIQQMVAAGLGVCSLPEHSVIVPGLALRPVAGMNLAREVTLVAVSGSGVPMELRQLLKIFGSFDWGSIAA